MENRLVTTEELRAFDQPIPEGVELAAFKLVNIGPKTLVDAEHSGAKICEIADQQPCFFIISHSPEALRQILHDYVDRFCDRREGK